MATHYGDEGSTDDDDDLDLEDIDDDDFSGSGDDNTGKTNSLIPQY